MSRYCSHTLILPDESQLDNMVVEVADSVVSYYPFTGEVHTTLYVDMPILLSYRNDLEGKTVSLAQLTWALKDSDNQTYMYAYRLTPCLSCYGGQRFILRRL